MAKYIFAIEKQKIEEGFNDVDYHIIISTKEYFEQEGFVQDSYEEHEYEEINEVMNKYGAAEAMESTFECEDHDAEAIKEALNKEDLFDFSEKFQKFVDTWNDEE